MKLGEFVKDNLTKRDEEKYEQIYWLSKLAAVKRHAILNDLLKKNWKNASELKDCSGCCAFLWCTVQKQQEEFREPKHIQDCVDKVIEKSIVDFISDPQCSEEQVFEVALKDIHKFRAAYEGYEETLKVGNNIPWNTEYS